MRGLVFCAFVANLACLAIVATAQAQSTDDADAQLRIRQAANAVSTATREVDSLTQALDAERGRIVRTNEERELNQAVIADLGSKLAAARARLIERQAALKATQEARARQAPAPSTLPPTRPAAGAPAPNPQRTSPTPAVISGGTGPWALMRRMGLTGTWSLRCDRQPSAATPHWPWLTYYADAAGVAHVKRDIGSNAPQIGTILEAQQLAPKVIQLRYHQLGSTIEHAFAMMGRHYRTWRLTEPNGYVSIESGRRTIDGIEPLLVDKCVD